MTATPDSDPTDSVRSEPVASGEHEQVAAEGAAVSADVAVDASVAPFEVPKGAYHVALPAFEGPLDLLLHLIQQHQLDIFDIPIAFVAQRYVEYIQLMQELNIDLASEYLVMAATLTHIKSKMLLPVQPSGQEDEAEDDLDPRGDLVRRLLEYQKYKQAAEELGAHPVLGRDVFLRGASAPTVDGPAPLAEVSVFKLFDAFQKLLSRVKQNAEHLIDVDRISISERILQLTDLLRDRGLVPFEALFDEGTTRADLVVTFLALLEMTRLRMMRVVQEGPLAPISVLLTLSDEQAEVLARDAAAGDPLAALSRGRSAEARALESTTDDEGVAAESPREQPAWASGDERAPNDGDDGESDDEFGDAPDDEDS